MNYKKTNKCIRNAVKRIKPKKCQMSMYSYINYYCNKNDLSIEENLYIRKAINKYINKFEKDMFQADFTCNIV